MPKRKLRPPQPAEDTRYSNRDEWVSESANELRTRAAPQYDGVLGTPDSWLPENFQQEFRAARNQLLDDGYSVDQIQDLMAQEIRHYRIAVRNPFNPICYSGIPCPPKSRSAVLALARIQTAVRLERRKPGKGMAFLTDQSHADKVQMAEMAERYRQDQSRKAKRPRGKLEGADGQTINEIIGHLVIRNPKAGAKELWPHLYSKLDEYGSNPKEDHQKLVIEYDRKEERKTITFGTFEKVASQYRKGKKKLP